MSTFVAREIFFVFVRFRAAHVKEVVHTVLNEELAEKSYDAEETTALCKHLSNEIKGKLKGKEK